VPRDARNPKTIVIYSFQSMVDEARASRSLVFAAQEKRA
jgi:hypothetical protein